MRTFVIKRATDLKHLGNRLLGAGADRANAMQNLERLNPQVDFRKIESGTVLLIPDSPEWKTSETASITGEAFSSAQDKILPSVRNAVARIHSGHEDLAKQTEEVLDLLKDRSNISAILESDPEAQQDLESALGFLKQYQQRAEVSRVLMKDFETELADELSKLQKLLD